MDTTQLLLTIVLTVSTILLIIVGIQLVFVLKELRTSLIKINRIISGFEKVGESIEHGFGELTGFVAGFKTIFKFIDIFQKKKHGNSEQS